jgi:glucosylceramidase
VKNRRLLPICSVMFAVSTMACSSPPSSSGQNDGAGGTGTSAGGMSAAETSAVDGGSRSASNTSSTVMGDTATKAIATGGRSAGSTAFTGRGGDTSASGRSSAANTGGRSSGAGGASNVESSTEVGGSAAGGAGTSGVPTSAQLITSGQNDYFKTTEATVVTSGTADVTVDESTGYQRWDGFGGTFNEMGWDALSVLSAGEIADAMTLLFHPEKGANFVYGRIPMGASDYSMSWYTLDDTSSADYSMSSFSIARDEQKLIPFIKAALQINPDIRLWGSPWVVPSWMKDGSNNMKADAQTLSAHALYMARFVEEYAKQGFTIWAIQPQNEPGYARVRWKQADLISFMKTYLGPTFVQRKLTAEIWCGTMSKDPEDTNIALATAEDEEAMKYVKGFGLQWNPLAAVATLSKKGSVMQTEHRCGNYNFSSDYWNASQYNSSKAQNDHAYGEETWQLIRDWVVAGVNSYSAWNMVLDTVGKSLDGWPQDSLLVVDRSTKKLIQTPAYYAFRQFSQFILPGATRIAVNTSNAALKGISTQSWNGQNAVAFKNANGSIVTEVYNKGASAQTLLVNVRGTLFQISVPARGWSTLNVSWQ